MISDIGPDDDTKWYDDMNATDMIGLRLIVSLSIYLWSSIHELHAKERLMSNNDVDRQNIDRYMRMRIQSD